MRPDLFVDAQPCRLLLAHTSARNLLAYEARLRQRTVPLEEGLHRITVTNRGSWGELRFRSRDWPNAYAAAPTHDPPPTFHPERDARPK